MKTLTFAKNSAFLGRLPFEGRRRGKGAAEVGVGVGVGGGEVKEGMMCKVGRVLSHILSGKKKKTIPFSKDDEEVGKEEEGKSLRNF